MSNDKTNDTRKNTHPQYQNCETMQVYNTNGSPNISTRHCRVKDYYRKQIWLINSWQQNMFIPYTNPAPLHYIITLVFEHLGLSGYSSPFRLWIQFFADDQSVSCLLNPSIGPVCTHKRTYKVWNQFKWCSY